MISFSKKTSIFHRQVFFSVLFLSIMFSLWLLKDYLSLIISALIYSILISPLFGFIKHKLKFRSSLAAIATVSITFITIVIPLLLITTLIVQEAFSFRQSIADFVNSENLTTDKFVTSVNDLLVTLPGDFQITALDIEGAINQVATPTGTFIANQLINIGTSSAVFIANLFIFLILVFFIVPSLNRFKIYALKLSPLPDEIDKLYLNRILAMTRAMIKGTFFVALIQGVLAGILLFFMGVPYILILTLMMTLLAIIPLLSTNFVTLPIAIYFILTGSIIQGTIIILVQAVLISSIDNILRPLFASNEAHMHPAILLLAILGGIQVFGFWGIFYGPIIMIFLTTSLEVYEKHYR